MKPGILIVDDDPSILKGLTMNLEPQYHILKASKGKHAIKIFQKENPNAVLLDIGLPDMDGLEVLEKMMKIDTQSPIIMLTAVEDVKSVVKATKKGAFDYLVKPVSAHEIHLTLKNALETRQLKNHLQTIQKPMVKKYTSDFICKNQEMRSILTLAEKVTKSLDTPTLITGESGTGKGMLAKNIHYSTDESPGPFIIVNCSAVSKELVESELFGYDGGAFTGALPKGKKGYFEMADGGTLFLDEIGVMPQPVQAKLLNVLEDKRFYRVGGSKTIPLNARVIAATNTDLEKAIQENKFRQDLFFRLNVVPLKLPPLRERTDDILPLAEHFLGQFNTRFNKGFQSISSQAAGMLKTYHWPGNVRELRNTIERIVLLEENDRILPEHLILTERNAFSKNDKKVETLEEAEIRYHDEIKQIIEKALSDSENNVQDAAVRLNIPVHKLRYQMKKLQFTK